MKKNILDNSQDTEKKKFKENFYIAPQDGFVLANLSDIAPVLNPLQKAILFEIHHQMISKPYLDASDMPNWNGPYEVTLAAASEEVLNNFIFTNNSRSYITALTDPVSVQFFVKRAVDLRIEEEVKKFCRVNNIGLRYLDSSFFVECVQIWLTSVEGEDGKETNNTPANKEKVRNFTWDYISSIKDSDLYYSKDISYKKDRIVFYDDVLTSRSTEDLNRLYSAQERIQENKKSMIQTMIGEENE